MRFAYVVFTSWALLVAPVLALAHHSFTAEFDINRPIEFTGKVARVEWTNPHAWIHLDVETSDGKVENWAIELLGINALMRQGWTRDKIKSGDVLYVKGYAARNGTTTGNASIVTIEATGEQVWGNGAEEN